MFFSRVFSFFSNLVKFALFCFFFEFFFCTFFHCLQPVFPYVQVPIFRLFGAEGVSPCMVPSWAGGGAGLQESPQPMVVVTYVKNGLKWPEMAKWPKMA